jgi:DNA (cytosine-5)-methyltransferase 1
MSSHSLNLADSVKQYPTHSFPTPVKYITPRVGGEESLDSVEKRKGREAAERHNTLASVEAAHGEQPGQLNPDWVEWLMGWPIGWTSMEAITELDWRDWSVDPADEDSIPRVATGIKHRVGRLKAIGNGQVPQVAAMAWRILSK